MLERCSLYLSHSGMSLHPILKGLLRLAHFLIAISSSKRGYSVTISTASQQHFCRGRSRDKAIKVWKGWPVFTSVRRAIIMISSQRRSLLFYQPRKTPPLWREVNPQEGATLIIVYRQTSNQVYTPRLRRLGSISQRVMTRLISS